MDLSEIRDQIQDALNGLIKSVITEHNLELAGELRTWGQTKDIEITIKENMKKEICSLREKIEELLNRS